MQSPDNIFRGVLLNRFPPQVDLVTKQAMVQYFTQSDQIQDQATNIWCPLDKRMMQRALRENPDKENLYPAQINGIKELVQRQKLLCETQDLIGSEIKKQVKDAETMDREIQ